MTSSELKGILLQYPFLQNVHFCKLAGVKQCTLKSFLAGKFNLSEYKYPRLYIHVEEQNEAFKRAEIKIKENESNS